MSGEHRKKIAGFLIGMADGEERASYDIRYGHERVRGGQTVFCRKAAKAARAETPAKCC
jgi:hypothetical protein